MVPAGSDVMVICGDLIVCQEASPPWWRDQPKYDALPVAEAPAQLVGRTLPSNRLTSVAA